MRGLCRRSWEQIRVKVGRLGSGSGPTWAVLGADQGLPDGLGSRLGPTRAVLGVDQGLSRRSWERIRTKEALARAGKRSGQGSGSKSGANPSGKGIRNAGHSRNSRTSRGPVPFFFCRYVRFQRRILRGMRHLCAVYIYIYIYIYMRFHTLPEILTQIDYPRFWHVAI